MSKKCLKVDVVALDLLTIGTCSFFHSPRREAINLLQNAAYLYARLPYNHA